MHKAQANRARIAERAALTPRPARTPGAAATDLLARPASRVTALRQPDRSTKRSKGRGLSRSARDSEGHRSDWTRSPYAPYGGWQ